MGYQELLTPSAPCLLFDSRRRHRCPRQQSHLPALLGHPQRTHNGAGATAQTTAAPTPAPATFLSLLNAAEAPSPPRSPRPPLPPLLPPALPSPLHLHLPSHPSSTSSPPPHPFRPLVCSPPLTSSRAANGSRCRRRVSITLCRSSSPQACWEHTMDAPPATLRVPRRPWELIQSFMPPTLGDLFQQEGTIGKARAEATAQNYRFPDKRRAEGYVAYQTPFGRPEAGDVLRPIKPPLPPGPPFAALPAVVVESPLRLHPAFNVIPAPSLQVLLPLPAHPPPPPPLRPPPPLPSPSTPRSPLSPPILATPPAAPLTLPKPSAPALAPAPAPSPVITHSHGTSFARVMRAAAMR